MENIDWSEFYESYNPDVCWEFMYSNLVSVYDKLCPEKTYINVRKKSEWLTAELFELMRERERKF